jgi:hypothetical protein
MMSRLFLLVLIVATAAAPAPPAAPAPDPPADPSTLVVHEWGTFTTIAGENGRPGDWPAWSGPQDLPCFVERLKWCAKCTPGATVRMETPVLYFYGPDKASVDVSVSFPRGLLTEWYPRAAPSPADLPSTLFGSKGFTHTLSWSDVTLAAGDAAFPTEPGTNHYYEARDTDAVPLRVGSQREKFLFYRGVARFDIPLHVTSTPNDRVAVTNTGPDAIAAVILFERRGERVGFRVSKAVRGRIAFEAPALTGALEALATELEQVLTDQGLFRREASAMVETWRDSWFEDGTRVIYVVPLRFVDAVLPLRISPAPSAISRVFVGRIELFTPATLNEVKAAIDANQPQAAARYGRFLPAIMNRIFPPHRTELDRRPADRVLAPVYAASADDKCAAPRGTRSTR